MKPTSRNRTAVCITASLETAAWPAPDLLPMASEYNASTARTRSASTDSAASADRSGPRVASPAVCLPALSSAQTQETRERRRQPIDRAVTHRHPTALLLLPIMKCLHLGYTRRYSPVIPTHEAQGSRKTASPPLDGSMCWIALPYVRRRPTRQFLYPPSEGSRYECTRD